MVGNICTDVSPCRMPDVIAVGLPTVLIGDIEAVAGPAIFPGVQSHRNCGVQCMQQVIRQTTGVVHSEEEMLHLALAGGFVRRKPAGFIGGTGPRARHDMLAAHGVASTTVAPPAWETDEPENIAAARSAHNAATKQALAEALRQDKAVIVGLDAGQLWFGKPDGYGHAVLVTGGDFDGDGSVTHVYLNDTEGPDPGQRQARCIPADEFQKSLDSHVDRLTGTHASCLNVIETPMWTSTPIDLNPPRLSGSSFGHRS